MSLPAVLLLGLGRMGGAMAAGWREIGLAPSYAIDPNGRDLPGVTCVADPGGVPEWFRPAAVILAVKPQMAEQALPRLTRYAGDAVFLSIMAGRTLAGLGAMLGPRAAVVRAMPNTPAAIRQGISVACAGAAVGAAQRALCDALLRAVGDVVWTQEEGQLDAVTAVSGGGPAYVFLLAELLEQAAVAQGLPAELARMLARQTVSGAGAMLAASTEDAAELRRAVTSPKGTTERALAVLLAEWPAPMQAAIKAATERSRELAR
jgi:pyrroline-5-carboxylate reductase